MSNRWIRFGIAVLALAVAAAAASRIHQQEKLLAAGRASALAIARAAERALVATSEVKAALHAYVAAGQGHAFWTGRAASLIQGLRESMQDLEQGAAAAGLPPTGAADSLGLFIASEQRARRHVSAGEELMASDIIFTEARDLLDAVRIEVARTRDTVAADAETRQAALRQEQLMVALGAASVLALAVLILVPVGRAPTAGSRPVASSASDETVGYGPGVRTSRPATAISGTAPAAGVVPSVAPVPAESAPAPPTAPVGRIPPQAQPPAVSLSEAAAVCSDFAKLSDSGDLPAILERAARVLGASGIIVWMASAEGEELFPAASAGYDARLLARIDAIPRDASNLTAAAFRDGSPRMSDRTGTSAAALAAPVVGPNGVAGVLSAELRDAREADAEHVAVARILAAQLATLLASSTAPSAEESGGTAQLKARS